jgi:hypothetical protein
VAESDFATFGDHAMSDNNSNLGFGKFVPGFDFLQNLAKGASQTMPQMPNLSNWIAPTLNVEELEKRISDLKAVHFWLDQNAKALGATIQALEVQKMTLATLKGMNFNMGEVANALKLKTPDSGLAGAQKAAETAAADTAASAAKNQPAPKKAKAKAAGKPDGGKAPNIVDPLQWWGSLTQQFQQIAADAMKDAAAHTGMDAAKNMGGGAARGAVKSAPSAAKKRAAKRPAKKSSH